MLRKSDKWLTKFQKLRKLEKCKSYKKAKKKKVKLNKYIYLSEFRSKLEPIFRSEWTN